MAILRKIWPFLVLVVLCLFAIYPLFQHGFFPIHDDEQVARLQQITLAINSFNIPPRWVPDLGFGFGFPLFNFYPPLFYYFGYIIHLFGFSFLASTKITIGLGFILSAFFMYLWAKRHYGVVPAIFAALLYTYVPYHAVDLYVRGALSEFFSFVFLPLVFLSFDLLAEKKTYQKAIAAGIFLTLVILSHNLVFIQLVPLLFIYLAYLLIKERKHIKKVLPLFIFSGVLAVCLSLYFTLPSLMEKQFTLVDKILTGELADYKLYFVCPSQLISSFWGYGGSIPGCMDGMSFQIGKVHLFVSIFSLMLVLFSLPFKKYFSFKIEKAAIVLVLLVVSIFMTLSVSSFIWQILSLLSYIQFPWRFLLFISLFSSFLGGFCIYFLTNFIDKRITYPVLFILVVLTFYFSRDYFKPQSHLDLNDSFYASSEDIKWRVSRMSYEYVPRGVATKISEKGTTVLDIEKSDVPEKTYAVLTGKMNVNEDKNTPEYKKYTVEVIEEGEFRINTYSFPGWEVLVDSSKVEYNDNNKFKLITLKLPKGNHKVEAVFNDTLPRRIGNIVSGLSILAVLIYFLFSLKKKRNEKN